MNLYSMRWCLCALLPVLAGCQRSEEILGEAGPTGRQSEVSAYDYSLNHFFVDTLYRSAYEPYFGSEPPVVVMPAEQIVRQEVWIARVGLYPDPNEILCRSFLNLPPRGDRYDPGLSSGQEDTLGVIETGPMVMLNVAEYTMLGDGYTGILSINRPFNDYQRIAIAYRRADGIQIGEFLDQVSLDSLYIQKRSLVLHLVKPTILLEDGRSHSVAWNMLVKSIYPLGPAYTGGNGVSLRIVRRTPGMADLSGIRGHSFLNMLGLDSYGPNGVLLQDGDGVFDLRPFRTFDPVHGEVIFPSLRPFDTGIREYFSHRGPPGLPDSSYLMPQIYDTTVSAARTMGRSTYILQWAP
jgi:hypothetical protein